jgi:opacity protein-like surface antigen
MNKILLTALAAASALAIATPAAAQDVTGTVNITGSVGEKCMVTGDGPASSSFTTTVALGELSQADGTMRTDLATSFDAGGTGGSTMDFRVVCTTAAPEITVDADPIVAENVTSPPSGYANTIDYVAHVQFDLVASGSQTVDNDTQAASTVEVLTDRLATGADNVHITATGFTTGTNDEILVADSYTGIINITIAPAA